VLTPVTIGCSPISLVVTYTTIAALTVNLRLKLEREPEDWEIANMLAMTVGKLRRLRPSRLF